MPVISSYNLALLPTPTALRSILKSMAMLDAILCPEWQYRCYSFNSDWSAGEEMGSMRNGQGDEFFSLFNSYGSFLKGFVHDSAVAAAGCRPTAHYQGVPAELASCVSEPAFKPDDVTFCLWRSFSGSRWVHNAIRLPPGTDPDGSAYLLSPLDGEPETYWEWAQSYYERDVNLNAVKAVYARKPLTDDLVSALNAELQLLEMVEDIREIGYPM